MHLEPLRPDELGVVRRDLVVQEVLQDEAGRDLTRAQERGEQHGLLLAEPGAALERRVARQSSRVSTTGRHVVGDLVPHPVEEDPRRLGALRVAGEAVGGLPDAGASASITSVAPTAASAPDSGRRRSPELAQPCAGRVDLLAQDPELLVGRRVGDGDLAAAPSSSNPVASTTWSARHARVQAADPHPLRVGIEVEHAEVRDAELGPPGRPRRSRWSPPSPQPIPERKSSCSTKVRGSCVVDQR